MTSDEKLSIACAFDCGYQQGYDDGKHDGASDERKRTVKWLRSLPVPLIDDVGSQIEAGEHLK